MWMLQKSFRTQDVNEGRIIYITYLQIRAQRFPPESMMIFYPYKDGELYSIISLVLASGLLCKKICVM